MTELLETWKSLPESSVAYHARRADLSSWLGLGLGVGLGLGLGSGIVYIFSELLAGSSSLDEIFFSAARTTPSEARIPMAVPACDIASIAYST